jgi:predicted nucleotide-binding protein
MEWGPAGPPHPAHSICAGLWSERRQTGRASGFRAFSRRRAIPVNSEPDARSSLSVQIHEVGLFQGRLGFTKAIVLLEDTCEAFSNIEGLGQIRFPKGNLNQAFEEIRQVLEREKILQAPADEEA